MKGEGRKEERRKWEEGERKKIQLRSKRGRKRWKKVNGRGGRGSEGK